MANYFGNFQMFDISKISKALIIINLCEWKKIELMEIKKKEVEPHICSDKSDGEK